jgi:hypothetical protein
VRLVAPYTREDLLFRIAAQLEQAMPWKDRTPTPSWESADITGADLTRDLWVMSTPTGVSPAWPFGTLKPFGNPSIYYGAPNT